MRGYPPQGVTPHHERHEPGGVDEVNDIDIGNTGVLLSAHAARHVKGGADEITDYLNMGAIPVRAGIARGSTITLPVKVCMWLAWDVVAGSFISSKVLPWWNKRTTTLNIVKASQDTTAGDIVSSFVTPDFSPLGVAWDGENLWNADVSASKIFELTTTGTIVSSFASPDLGPFGLAWDGENLWNADDSVSKIFELTTTGTIVSSFASPGATAQGLVWDGVHLWHTDSGAVKIFELKDGKRNVRYIAVEAA